MKKIKTLNEFYSERISENQLKTDYINENLSESEFLEGLLEFLKMKDEKIEGIHEDALDYIIETKIEK